MAKNKDQGSELSKLLAGQLGISAVLANVLIDKGIVSREDLCDRFRQARDAAARSSAGPQSARLLAAMLSYVEKGRQPTEH